MTRYITNFPCRPIRHGTEHGHMFCDCAKDAAWIFANRYARRIYGKRGFCHHVRLDTYTENGRYHNFEAFIGIPDGYMGGTNGKNIRLSVTTAED